MRRSFKANRKCMLVTACVLLFVIAHTVIVREANSKYLTSNDVQCLTCLVNNVTRKEITNVNEILSQLNLSLSSNKSYRSFLAKNLSNDLSFAPGLLPLNSSEKLRRLAAIALNVTVPQKRQSETTTINFSDNNIMPYNFTDYFNEFDITDLDDHVTFRAKVQTGSHQFEGSAKGNYTKIISARNVLRWTGDYETKLNNTPEYRRQVYDAFYRPVKNQGGVNCSDILENDPIAITKAQQIMRDLPRRGVNPEKYARTTDCENFRGGRGYIEHPLSQKELDFPLAFMISVYTDLELAERLLRAIYRPHNYYCIHLDTKMSHNEQKAFEKIANCLDNVFISETSLNVTWGTFSVLEMELVCMKQLWKYKKWKYYINLTGQEFPLKTNREIVAILDAIDGANLVDGTWIRAKQKYFYRWTQAGNPPPHRIRPIKGSIHVALNRHFVDFALHDPMSHDFLEWLKKTQIPDETFFPSLNHNPHLQINGSFLGEAEEYPLKPSLMRYKNWELGHSVFARSCSGKYVRHICVLGVGDLHKAYNDIGLFVNKFNLDFEYLALDCLEEVMHKKTWDQYLQDVYIDTNYFKHLDYVKKKLFVPP